MKWKPRRSILDVYYNIYIYTTFNQTIYYVQSYITKTFLCLIWSFTNVIKKEINDDNSAAIKHVYYKTTMFCGANVSEKSYDIQNVRLPCGRLKKTRIKFFTTWIRTDRIWNKINIVLRNKKNLRERCETPSLPTVGIVFILRLSRNIVKRNSADVNGY